MKKVGILVGREKTFPVSLIESNYSLAAKLGVAVPKTVLLPQKAYIEGITSDSLRNLEFPLDWQAIADYVGFPAFIKPFDGGGWKNVSKVNSLEELWRVYDTTGTLCMTLQESIEWDRFVRCYCIGQEDVLIMPYDPRKSYLSGEQYVHDPTYLSGDVAARVAADVLTLNRALGYDINTVEFAIRDDVPYAIDFMNPAPDAVEAVTDAATPEDEPKTKRTRTASTKKSTSTTKRAASARSKKSTAEKPTTEG